MIKSPEFAAEKMFIGLTKKNAFEIHFPIAFTMIMKLLKIMPNWLYFLLLKKGMQGAKEWRNLSGGIDSKKSNAEDLIRSMKLFLEDKVTQH